MAHAKPETVELRPGTAPPRRSLPQQARAKAAVERILDATGELLDEAGFENLTTTAIAERADVNIATLYRYFPDKFTVVQEYALRHRHERAKALSPLLEKLALQREWRQPLKALVEGLVRFRLTRPGGRTLERALQAAPRLWETDQSLHQDLIIAIAGAIHRRKPRLGQRQIELIAGTALAAMTGILNRVAPDAFNSRRSIAEAVLLLERYLGPHLEA